jgi:hypothetical protein
MEFAPDDFAMPEIPTIDSVCAEFPVLVATLVPQPSIHAIGADTTSSSRNGGPFRLETAAITYAIFWNPDDLDDPVNHVQLPPDVVAALANPSPKLPPALVDWLPWMRFPTAYEAVQTVVPRDGRSIADELALHMRNVVGNTFRAERNPLPHEPDTFVDPPSAADAVEASVLVDGELVDCVEIHDEHVLGLGVGLSDAVALVVLPKHLLPLLRVELVRRARPTVAA